MSAPYGFRETPGLEKNETQQHRVPHTGPDGPIMSPPAAIPCTSIGTVYRGGRGGEGYAVTPKTDSPAYIKTPLLPGRLVNYEELLRKLKKRGTNPYGGGR